MADSTTLRDCTPRANGSVLRDAEGFYPPLSAFDRRDLITVAISTLLGAVLLYCNPLILSPAPAGLFFEAFILRPFRMIVPARSLMQSDEWCSS